MLRKILQRSALLLKVAACVCVWTAVPAAVPSEAYAYSFAAPPDPVHACPSLPGFTKRVVTCIRDSILSAVNAVLGPFVVFIYEIVGGMLTLAVALWGVLLATGRMRFAVREGFALAIKMGVIIMLFTGASMNFTSLFGSALDAVGELLSTVTKYVSFSPALDGACSTSLPPMANDPLAIWDRVDCLLDLILGGVIGSSTVFYGLSGFLLASFISDSAGWLIAMLGLYMIVELLFAVFRAVYIFILAYFAIAIMALAAPMFVPLILFKSTRAYFEKWAKLTIGFILQPIFLFTYLAMLLAAFDTVVYSGPSSLFRAVAGTDYTNMTTIKIGKWLHEGTAGGLSAYGENSMGNMAFNTNSGGAAKQTVGHVVTGGGPSSTPKLDLGKQQTGVADTVGQLNTKIDEWKNISAATGKTNIYESLGLEKFFFFVNLPITVVDWDDLAQKASVSNTAQYVQNLILAFVMACATAIIFYLLLEALPFIGSGITGDVFSTPAMGFGGLGPPGMSMVNGLRDKVFGT